MKHNLIGITEQGDAGLDLSWANKLDKVIGTILITKNINDSFIDKLIESYNKGYKIILHVTCTGWGGTEIEPYVPDLQTTHNNFKKLIGKGFPIENCVLRIDPIILKDFSKFFEVANKFLHFEGLKRLRFSFIDYYSHVKNRLVEIGRQDLIIYDRTYMYNMQDMFLDELEKHFISKRYELETCAENSKYDSGCISEKDLFIFNLPVDIIKGKSNQRKNCKCIGNKYELLSNKRPCNNDCVYCYWRS